MDNISTWVRGILIDPFKVEVRQVGLSRSDDGDFLQALYGNIGCDYVQCLSLGRGIDIWFDEEYSLKQSHSLNSGIILRAGKTCVTILGRSILLGCDGDDVSGTSLDVQHVLNSIRFFQVDGEVVA